MPSRARGDSAEKHSSGRSHREGPIGTPATAKDKRTSISSLGQTRDHQTTHTLKNEELLDYVRYPSH
jgi:hypothetical protein